MADMVDVYFPVSSVFWYKQKCKIYTANKMREQKAIRASVDEYLRRGGVVTRVPDGPPPEVFKSDTIVPASMREYFR